MGSLTEVGLQLREAREAQGLTLEEVATRTRISVRHLRAIEAGDESELPEVFYVRGFLKKYAEIVGLSPTYVADAYRSAPAVATSPADSRFSAGPLGYYILLLALIGGALALAWHFQPRVTVVEGPSPPPLAASPSPSPSLTPAPAVMGPTPPAASAAASPSPAGSAEASPSPPASPSPSPSPSPAASPSSGASPTPVGAHEVQLLVDRRVWIEVRVDDARAFTGIVQAGERKRFSGRRVSVLAGNGQSVRVLIDGADAGFLGSEARVTRRTLP